MALPTYKVRRNPRIINCLQEKAAEATKQKEEQRNMKKTIKVGAIGGIGRLFG
jgi:hypothetical protein